MVDVELLGEFAMIVLRDCEACKSVSQEMLDSLHRSGGECFRKAVDQLKGTDQLFVLEKCYRTSFNELSKLNAASVTVVSPILPRIVDVAVLKSETTFGTLSKRLFKPKEPTSSTSLGKTSTSRKSTISYRAASTEKKNVVSSR
jgi:hypothetical protein